MGELPSVATAKAVKKIESDAAWEQERAAFYRMFDELMKDYKDQFVVICQRRVVASGNDKFAVARAAMKQCPGMPAFIHKVTTEPIPVVRLQSPIREVGKI